MKSEAGTQRLAEMVIHLQAMLRAAGFICRVEYEAELEEVNVFASGEVFPIFTVMSSSQAAVKDICNQLPSIVDKMMEL